MAWFFLLLAGALETAWALGLKLAAERSSAGLVVVTAVTMAASFAALYVAMIRLPLGVAYPIWTGIGSVGSVAVGALLLGQQVGTPGIIGVVLLILGMILIGMDIH